MWRQGRKSCVCVCGARASLEVGAVCRSATGCYALGTLYSPSVSIERKKSKVKRWLKKCVFCELRLFIILIIGKADWFFKQQQKRSQLLTTVITAT